MEPAAAIVTTITVSNVAVQSTKMMLETLCGKPFYLTGLRPDVKIKSSYAA